MEMIYTSADMKQMQRDYVNALWLSACAESELAQWQGDICCTIFKQILSSVGLSGFCSWGAYNMHLSTAGDADEYGSDPILSFCVQGFCFEGRVSIRYNQGIDYYTVTFEGLDAKDELSRVSCEELGEILDNFIEKDVSDDEYHAKVCKHYGIEKKTVIF